MAPKKNERKPGPLGTVGPILVLVLQFISLFFMCIGTPYDVFKPRPGHEGVTEGLCYSLWGSKICGGSHAHATHNIFWSTCGVFEASMKAGSAFGIISIGFMSITIMVLFAYICKVLQSNIPLILLTLLSTITSCVPWAVVAGLYHNSTCGYPNFSVPYELAAGFAFLVVSFGLQVITFILMCLS